MVIRVFGGRWVWAGVALLTAAILLINPIGFVGRGSDDARYLEAARCWVAHGAPCLPGVHWATRWPVVASLAGAISLIGDNRLGVGLGALPWWIASLALAGFLAGHWFGRGAAMLAVLLLALTPIVTAAALQPSADVTELAFQLAALSAATLAFRHQSRLWAIVAGLAAALALQTRDTSFLFVGVAAVAWFLLPGEQRRILLWAVPGLVAGVAAEMLVYGLAAGDPLFRFKLSLAHVAVPSSELPPGFDTRQRPFFNPAYVAAWRREVDVDWHWSVDPWINLLASFRINVAVIGSLLAAALFWSKLEPRCRRSARVLLAAAALIALLLVYGLAVDPDPRIFMPQTAALAIVAGASLAAGWRSGSRPAMLVVMAAVACLQITTLAHYPNWRNAEQVARRWIAAYPNQIEIDESARTVLTLVPEARALPPRRSGRKLVLMNAPDTCRALMVSQTGENLRLVEAANSGNLKRGQICLFANRT